MNENERIVYRSHFSVLLTKATGVLAALAVLIVTNLRDAERIFRELKATGGIPSRYNPVLLGLLVLLAFLAALAVRRWWRTYIILDGTNLIVHRATMIDRQNMIDLATVSSVNLEQNLLQMILGVYRIRIDTNSASTAEDTDVDLVLARNKAEEFKNLVMSRMGTEDPVPVNPQELYHNGISFSTGVVLRHALFSTSITGLLIGVAGLTLGSGMLIDDMHGIDTTSPGKFLTSLVVLLVAVWSLIGPPVKSFLHLYDFRCMRHEDSLRLAYGLTKRQDFSIPVSKIHAVTVKQGFLARIFGYEELQIAVIGMGDDDGEVCNLSLYLKRDRIAPLMNRLLPEYEQLYQMEWERKRGGADSSRHGTLCADHVGGGGDRLAYDPFVLPLETDDCSRSPRRCSSDFCVRRRNSGSRAGGEWRCRPEGHLQCGADAGLLRKAPDDALRRRTGLASFRCQRRRAHDVRRDLQIHPVGGRFPDCEIRRDRTPHVLSEVTACFR